MWKVNIFQELLLTPVISVTRNIKLEMLCHLMFLDITNDC